MTVAFARDSLSHSLELELGTPGVIPNAVTGIGWVDQWEDVPELRWPTAGHVYNRMRKDAQVRGAMRAVLQPIMARARFRISPDGADPRVVQFVATELGLLPERRSRARKRRQGISWERYAREAMATKAWAGHAVFEQVYNIGAPTPDQALAGMPGIVAHLAKLAPRPPRTLTTPAVEKDGGLTGWQQWAWDDRGYYEQILLPIGRLVVHVNEMEGADWYGQSLLRGAWKHWTIRDVLFRVGAMAVERNGLGIPVVTYDTEMVGKGVTRARAVQLAKAVRAGDEAGIALPEGYSVSLMGVSGQTRDEMELLKYHGEMISRNLTAMVLDLGHDAGARSLGDTFLQLLCMAQNAYADEFCDEVTEYVIRDLVSLTFGDDEPVPPVIHDELEPTDISWTDLAAFTKAGLIIPDDALEAELRRRRGLPLWPGAEDGPTPLDFDIQHVVQVQPDQPGPDDPPVVPDPSQARGRQLELAEARARAVLATVEARRAARANARP